MLRCRFTYLPAIAIVFALPCAQAAGQTSPSPFAVTLSASPIPVAPGYRLTFTLVVTNTSQSDLPGVYVGVVHLFSETLVEATAPGFTPTLHQDCALTDCSPAFVGFRMPMFPRGSQTALRVTYQVRRPPGATLRTRGFVWGAASVGYPGFFWTGTASARVAGSGVVPLDSSMLVVNERPSISFGDFQATDVAFDPRGDGHLFAGFTNGAAAFVRTDSSGYSTGLVQLNAPLARFGFFDSAHVAYSADLGGAPNNPGVMMIWAENPYSANGFYTPSVVFARGVVSSTLAATPLAFLGEGRAPRIAYSVIDREFLVVWKSSDSARILARRIALDGQPVGPAWTIAQAGAWTFSGVRLVWNPVTNEFGLSLHNSSDRGFTDFIRLAPDRVLTRQRVAYGPMNAVLDVNTRTGEYVLVWSEDMHLFGAQISRGGTIVSRGLVALDTAGVRSLAFNPASETFLVLDHGGRIVELNQYGAPLSPLIDGGLVNSLALISQSGEWRMFERAETSPVATRSVATIGPRGGGDSSLGGCESADPFAFFGGGSCFNGGWLPPGIHAPGVEALVYSPGPDVSPIPSPSGECATPDPFVTLGGGTCRNGGWLPPGMTPPPSPPAGCSTPDPFVALGGGKCVNGGWLPPGMTPP